MKEIVLLIIAFSVQSLLAQNNFKAVVKDKATLEPLEGVTVSASNNLKTTTATNKSGIALLNNLTAGTDTIHFSSVGYKPFEVSITIPDTTIHTILLERDETALQNIIVVASTRNNDPIENATTKVEVLGIEEMNEEAP